MTEAAAGVSTRGRWLVGLLVLAGGLAAAPTLLLDQAVEQTRRCFEEQERRQSEPLPPCNAAAETLAKLSRMPTTARAATRLAEELRVRWALTRYLDAAVGRPDAEQRRERFAELLPLAAEVEEGSGQQRFDELGPPLAGPEPGAWAQRVGDAAVLAEGGLRHSRHYIAGPLLRSLLLAGQDERARKLAARYAGNPDDELRLTAAALLCIDGQAHSGIDELAELERRRADKRSANFWRHFGELRLVMEACAARGEAKAPPLPGYGYAGSFDQRARVLALRLRRAAPRCDEGKVSRLCEPAGDAVADAIEQLRQGSVQPHRLALLAAVAPAIEDPVELRGLARHAKHEPTEHDGGLALDDWLPADRAPRDQLPAPYVPAESYERAAAHALLLAQSEDSSEAPAKAKPSQGGPFAPKPSNDSHNRPNRLKDSEKPLHAPNVPNGSDDNNEPNADSAPHHNHRDSSDELIALARRWMMHAAVGHARAGRVAEARKSVEAAVLGRPASEQRQLRATVATLHGDLSAARRAMADEPAGSPLRRASYLLQRAELLLPDTSAALSDLTRIDPLLPELPPAQRARLERRLLWLRAAAGGEVPDAAPPRRPAGPRVGHVPLDPAAARQLDRATVAQWRSWIEQPPPRVAARYQAWRTRGAPAHSLAAFFWLAGQLADSPEQTEVWLDALGSHAQRALPLRRYAFARARAALWRGDGEAHALWWRRYQRLESWAHHPELAELYRALRI